MVRCIHGDALRLVFFSKMKSLRCVGLDGVAAWAGAARGACNNTSNGNNNGNDIGGPVGERAFN